jgi:8-oxo-dGTP diphosphatase
VVAVVQRDERYLLIRRAARVVVPHAWCFVGGAIEPGESQPDAVVREFAEELGGRVAPVRKIWEYTRPDGRLLLHWWEAELLGDELTPNPLEVATYRWCTVAEIAALPNLLDSNRAFLRAIGLLPGDDANAR